MIRPTVRFPIRKRGILHRLVIGVVLTSALMACRAAPHLPLRTTSAMPTATPAPVRLPNDDRPHDTLTEWWYYTGHLAGGTGQKYGFEEVIFQVERQGVPAFYAAHFAITDHQRGVFAFDQRTWFRDRPPTTFDLGDGSWQIGGDGSRDRIRANMPDYALEATLTPAKPPAIHGSNGIISFGAVGDSYYYSTTRSTIEGAIVDHGVKVPVTGEAWKDRQWGNFLVTPAGGWDWYSFQLGDGSDLMLFVLRDSRGTTTPAYGTFVDAAGNASPIRPTSVTVAPTGSWTSPQTKTTYPSGWSIDIPDRDIRMIVIPVQANQELDTRTSTGQIYWEGEVEIAGTVRGGPLTGNGYVELTGYSTRSP